MGREISWFADFSSRLSRKNVRNGVTWARVPGELTSASQRDLLVDELGLENPGRPAFETQSEGILQTSSLNARPCVPSINAILRIFWESSVTHSLGQWRYGSSGVGKAQKGGGDSFIMNMRRGFILEIA